MTIEHRVVVPDDADVTLTIKATVAEVKLLTLAVSEFTKTPGNYRACLGDFLSILTSATRKAESTIYSDSK